jgi:hypothetical protein
VGDVDPQRAILEHLARPPGPRRAVSRSPGGVEASIGTGNPFRAELSSVRFVKQRASQHRQVFFVTFDGSLPQLGPELHRFGYVFALDRDQHGGWLVSGASGGAGGTPHRRQPWVNLGGGGWPDPFFAGGQIDRAGIDITRLRLQFANGVVLDDNSDHNVALFITDDPVALPATVSLQDRSGTQVAMHAAFASARPSAQPHR